MTFRHCIITAAALAFASCAELVGAQGVTNRPLTIDLIHKADVVAVAGGKGTRGVRYLDNTDVIATLDLDRAVRWHGATTYLGILSNTGARANDIAGTLQGVDNIEVASPDLVLYQAWVQQRFWNDRASVLVGKYDLNSEFYYNAAAFPLIAPAFGIGSELASTGPNGPSIFPQTDLAVRVRTDGRRHYAQAAIVRAPRGVADDGGRRSAMMIAEIGLKGRTAISVGGWTYSHRQPRITPPGITTTTDTAASHGLYVLIERELVGRGDAPDHWTGFLRAGLSDGLTTPFADGVQFGVTGIGFVRGRPQSSLSIGFATAGISSAYRQANPPAAPRLARSESTIELTYSDRVASFLTLQPDLQYVHRPSGRARAPGVVVIGLRGIVNWKIR
ncbi:carbohydrate porin [Sphingomonas sp. CFBP8993]|uniref:carbohydrate porin n=1 Tax=Sphingomonas sp. CFBP8993 TaxID=3096526 RepID=UPI002A6A84F4|nr:carbohydrate porin [Sphingomonas sp. CFBP8993]MDY0957264.1 carbohydrate porin [Sphingomonas sp. CFBP8993]